MHVRATRSEPANAVGKTIATSTYPLAIDLRHRAVDLSGFSLNYFPTEGALKGLTRGAQVLACLEEKTNVPFCLIDDFYAKLNPQRGATFPSNDSRSSRYFAVEPASTLAGRQLCRPPPPWAHNAR